MTPEERAELIRRKQAKKEAEEVKPVTTRRTRKTK